MAIDLPQNTRDGLPNQTTPISARDSTTGVVVPNVGDTANKAIRVTVIGTGGGGTQYADGTAFVAGSSIGTMGLAVVDDGSVAVPAVGDMTPLRIDTLTRGLIVGPQSHAAVQGSEFGVIPLAIQTADLGDTWEPFTILAGLLQVGGTVAISTVSGGVTTIPTHIGQQIGPFVANNDRISTGISPAPQTKLAVAMTSDGTVTTATLTITVKDQFGNESTTVGTVTQADLGILKSITVGFPFKQVSALLSGLAFGTGTELTLSVTTAP